MNLMFFDPKLADSLSESTDVVNYVRSRYGPFPFKILELDPRSGYKAISARETWVDLAVHVPRSDFEVALEHFAARQASVGYNTWVLPNLGGVTSKPNALVLRWALFFSLSVRARYEPEGWTKDLDPDSSPLAVQLEDVLDDAPQRCQALLLEAIQTVCS